MYALCTLLLLLLLLIIIIIIAEMTIFNLAGCLIDIEEMRRRPVINKHNNNNLYFVLLVHKVHHNAEHSKYNKYCECRSIGPTEKNEN